MIPAAYRYSPAAHKVLPEIWSDLLRSGRLISVVLEDAHSDATTQILGVGLSVFVNDEFVDTLLANPAPYVNARLHDMLLSGESPILFTAEIIAANINCGLNLLPLHFCTPSVDITQPNVLRTLAAPQDLFRVMHSGYIIKRVVKEVVNIHLSQFMQTTGMKLRCDYVAAHPALELDCLPETERPYLLYVNHEELPLGSAMSLMFITMPVRFHFSPAEQKLLLCAILRESDNDIANDLHLSQDTVRKHWDSIFQRVQNISPTFIQEESETKLNERTRGRGKRRHLLRYLHMRMEELRPHGRRKTNGDKH